MASLKGGGRPETRIFKTQGNIEPRIAAGYCAQYSQGRSPRFSRFAAKWGPVSRSRPNRETGIFPFPDSAESGNGVSRFPRFSNKIGKNGGNDAMSTKCRPVVQWTRDNTGREYTQPRVSCQQPVLSQAQWLYEAPIQGPRESETARVNIF